MKSVKRNSKIVLLIIDGFGIAEDSEGNAITRANTPLWNKLLNEYPHISLEASGNFVGLPDGIMGNSEVGHLTIGAGRIIYQSLELINRSCNNNRIEQNPCVAKIINHLQEFKGDLHLMGLISDGGVHSHQNHLFKLMKIFSKKIQNKIYIHAFTDGRDSPLNSAYGYIENLQAHCSEYKNIELSSIIGRYYAMDRDKKWDRTKIAYDMLINMDKYPQVSNPLDEIKNRYNKNEFDEFFTPIIVNNQGKIKDNDAIIFFNFRPDRARQITEALNNQVEISQIELKNLLFTTMTRYEKSWEYPVWFEQGEISECLAEIVSNSGLRQAHIAETEKYAHVTYFINGGREEPFKNEKRILIPSSKVATYDLKPEMSTIEIAKNAIELMKRNYELIIINIAAPDMVGHTGVFDATIKAIEVTDKALGMIYGEAIADNYVMIITSDHGNSEQLISDGNPHTAHTTNPVPFLITNKSVKLLQNQFGLANVTPTILELLHIPIPASISEKSLLAP